MLSWIDLYILYTPRNWDQNLLFSIKRGSKAALEGAVREQVGAAREHKGAWESTEGALRDSVGRSRWEPELAVLSGFSCLRYSQTDNRLVGCLACCLDSILCSPMLFCCSLQSALLPSQSKTAISKPKFGVYILYILDIKPELRVGDLLFPFGKGSKTLLRGASRQTHPRPGHFACFKRLDGETFFRTNSKA